MKISNEYSLNKLDFDLFKKAISFLPGHVYIKDLNSVYVGCSYDLALSIGLESPTDIVGITDYDLVDKQQADKFVNIDKQVIETKQKVVTENIVYPKLGSHEYICFQTEKIPLYQNEKIIGILSVALDITSVKKAEQRELEMKMQSQRKDLLEQFSRHDSVKEAVLAVAHEINQPLSAVMNYASGCQKRLQSQYGDTLPNEIQSGLKKCVEQARRAGSIVHTLKDMLCYKNYHPELTSVNMLINTVIALLAEEIDATKAKLELILVNNLQKIKCDRIQLELVLTNLIKNACEAIIEQRANNLGKSIIISTDEIKENNIKIIIENTGCTMRSDLLNKVFFPFSGTKEYGLGLGLALTKNIVDQHNGDIQVYLTETPSVRFEIILPAMKN